MLVDSVILIDHLNGIEEATSFLVQHDELCVSAITRCEVLCGIAQDARQPVVELLDTFTFLPIDAAIADLAASLRQRFRWKLADAVQAAAAQRHGLRLATRNTKDFDPKVHDFVVVPYRLSGKAR